jgi:hypothetical protein
MRLRWSRVGRNVAAAAVAVTLSACVSLSGLTGGGSDGGALEGGGHGADDGDEPEGGATEASPSDANGDASSSHAIALVQIIPAGSRRAANQSAQAQLTSGDLVVIAVYWDESDATVSVSDTSGNTWAHLDEQNNAANDTEVQIWYAQDAKGGNDTVTVTQSTGNSPLGFYLLEYSGIAATSSLDSQAGQSAPNPSTTMTTGTLPTSGALDVIVAIFSDSCDTGLMVAGTGFLEEGADTGFNSMVEDTSPAGVTPGTYNATAAFPSGSTDDMCWAATAAAFKAR